MRFLVVLALTLAFAQSTACRGGDDEEESFDNLPDCVAGHESLGEMRAITHCLVDFPDLHPDFATQEECVAWIGDNGGYPDTRDAACTDYFEEIGH